MQNHRHKWGGGLHVRYNVEAMKLRNSTKSNFGKYNIYIIIFSSGI